MSLQALKPLSAFFLCLAVPCFLALPAKSQSPAEIEKIVRSSKWIDKSRPVRAVVSGNLVTISTYCHQRASDQDCKINSLFILKELMAHFPNIHRLKISFFDPANAILFRTVDVKEGDAALIDTGKPVQEVLSQIDIVRGKLESARKNKTGGSWSNTNSNSTGSSSFSSSKGFKPYSSPDRDFSCEFPENWQIADGRSPGAICTATHLLSQVNVTRHELTATNTYEMVVTNSERMCVLNFKGFKQQDEGHKTFNRNSGTYLEGTFEPKCSVRGFFLHGREHCYVIYLLNYGSEEKDLGDTFRRILSSVSVRG